MKISSSSLILAIVSTLVVIGIAIYLFFPLSKLKGLAAQCPAVNVPGDALHILGVFVAPWRCHLEQDRELSWHHQVAGRGGCEHEPPAPLALPERELLRQRTAPRQAEHVHLCVPQLL